MGYPESQSQQGIDELRAILLGDDRQAMDGLRAQLAEQGRLLAENASTLAQYEQDIAQLRDRVGSDEQLRHAMAPVLSQVIADVEQSNPRPLSRAMSPFIVSSIRSEIANSKEAMVEALYPITGKLVSAAVRNSVASMMETINQRVDDATSARMISARFKSWRSGEPVSAYLMPGIGEVNFHSALLMERDTGAPICHVDPSGEQAKSEGQSNLVSGLLAALSNLTEEVFTAEDDELRTLDLNGRKITLRRSLRHLLVLEFVGTLSAEQHRAIDERFGDIVSLSENNDQAGLVDELSELMQVAQSVEEVSSQKKNFVSTGVVIALVALLTWYALGAWQRAQLHSAATELSQKISETAAFSSYPIEVAADFDANGLRVSGLVPENYDPLALRVQWQEWSTDYPVEVDLALIADAARTLQLEQQLELLHAENRVLRMREPVAGTSQTLQEQLIKLVESQRFIIGSDGTLVDSESSMPLLRRVARLLVASNLRLQVVGLVSESSIDDDTHPTIVANILRELGAGVNQLEIAVQPSHEISQRGDQVMLEVVSDLP